MRVSAVHVLAAVALVSALRPAAAFAQQIATTDVGVSGDVAVRLQLRSGDLVVRTWNRNDVRVVAQTPVQARLFGPLAVRRALGSGDLPVLSTTVLTPSGPLTLVPEQFALDPNLAPNEGVQIFAGAQSGIVTLTVPQSTVLLVVQAGRGSIRIDGYHGEFLAVLHNGAIDLAGVSGAGYVQAARGSIRAASSTFDRLRARTAIGSIVFENCTARQIEVGSIEGSIAYDNGTFVPGLARFESQTGNVVLGIAANAAAHIGAHSGSGRVFESLGSGASISGSKNDTQAIVDGGGPVVTATSGSGNVYLYRGAFKDRPALQRRWRPAMRALKARICVRPRCRV